MILKHFAILLLVSYAVTLDGQSCMEAYYPLASGTTDVTGNTNAQVNGNPMPAEDVNGTMGNALEMDGSGDYLVVDNEFDFPNRTISMWFNLDEIGVVNDVMYNSDNPNLQHGSTLLFARVENGEKSMRFSVSKSAHNVLHWEKIKEERWYHAAITVSDDSVKFYLDGVVINQFEKPANPASSIDGDPNTLLGCGRKYNHEMDGLLSNFRAYSCALSEAEIKELYENDLACIEADVPMDTTIQDESFNSYETTVTGSPIAVDDRNGNAQAAFEFNGDNFAQVNANFDFASRSYNVWFLAEEIGPEPKFILSSNNAQLENGSTVISVEEHMGQETLKYSVSSGLALGFSHWETIEENKWYKASITVSPDSIKYYLNCDLVATFPFEANSASNGTNTTNIAVDRNLENQFVGKIDDVVIHNCVVDQDYICQDVATGIEDDFQRASLKVYPNPFNDQLIIDHPFAKNGNREIQLLNSKGQVVYQADLSDDQPIDTRDLTSGVYVIRIIAGNQVATQKVIKP